MEHRVYLYRNSERVVVIGRSRTSSNKLLLFLDESRHLTLHDNCGIFRGTYDEGYLDFSIEEILNLIKKSKNSGYRYFYYSNNMTQTDEYVFASTSNIRKILFNL